MYRTQLKPALRSRASPLEAGEGYPAQARNSQLLTESGRLVGRPDNFAPCGKGYGKIGVVPSMDPRNAIRAARFDASATKCDAVPTVTSCEPFRTSSSVRASPLWK